MITNIIEVELLAADRVQTRPVHQWDVGQIIKVTDATIEDGTAVQFGNSTMKQGLQAYMLNGEVTIPAPALQQDRDLTAYVVVTDENSETTVKEIFIPVIAKPKPEDYVDEELRETTEFQRAMEAAEEAKAMGYNGEQAAQAAQEAQEAQAAAEAAQAAAEEAKEQAQFFTGDRFSLPVAVTIPAGRMRGDIDGDGKVGTFDKNNFTSSEYYGKTVDSTNIDSIACDIDGNGSCNSADMALIMAGSFKSAKYPEVTGNWQSNPNYATEEFQFYTDITIAELTTASDVLLIVEGEYSLGNFKATVPENGVLRVWIKNEMPILDSDGFVIFSKTGSGKCMATATAVTPANNSEKKAIVLAYETITPSDWVYVPKYRATMYRGYEEGSYPHSLYKMKLLPMPYSEEQVTALQAALLAYDYDLEEGGTNYITCNGVTPTIDLCFHVEFIPR